MPKMVMHRNFTLNSDLGHVIGFKKGEPVGVPPILVAEAMRYGAEMVTPTEKEKYVAETKKAPRAPTDPVERKNIIMGKMREMMVRNQRGDFNASGLPSNRVLERMLGEGWEIHVKERDAIWGDLQEILNRERDEQGQEAA